MPLICVECGNIFDECEAAVDLEYHSEVPGGAYERFMKCPCCGSDEIEESSRCKNCKGEFLPDELFGSYYCKECLEEALTFDNFLKFAEEYDSNLSESELHTVEHFMLVLVYGVSDNAISGSSKEFRTLMMAEFLNAAEAHNRAAKFGTDDKFLEQIWDYMKDYKMLDDFAEWLYEKEVRK